MHRQTITYATLLICVLLAAGTVQASRPSASAETVVYAPLLRLPTASIQTAEQQAIAQQIASLVNAERMRANPACPTLTINEALTRSAQAHSQDMAVANFFYHINLRGENPFDRARAAGYSGSIAENIAAGYSSAEAVMRDWMNSSGHRRNILNCNYREIGVGYYYQSDDQSGIYLGDNAQGSPVVGGPFFHYWTQVFGRP